MHTFGQLYVLIIKEHLKLIETKNKVTFKNAVVINDQNNFDCINVSGYKNLGGSQILEEDISFLLNNRLTKFLFFIDDLILLFSTISTPIPIVFIILIFF